MSASRAEVIAAGREIVAEAGLYITKKRYAAPVYDLEGERKDKDGKDGKVKAMGLDLRQIRYNQALYAGVPDGNPNDGTKRIQRTRHIKSILLSSVLTLRASGWEKGPPREQTRLGILESRKKGLAKLTCRTRKSVAQLEYIERDAWGQISMEIVDGMKVIVCKLRNNPLGYTL